MTKTGADVLAEILKQYGINRVFGNPGTTELPLIDAVDKKNLEFTLGLHEDIALGMAAGYSMKKESMDSGDITPVSVVNLHSTPGLLHGSGNLYNAEFSNIPLVVTTGSQNSQHEDRNPPLRGSREESIRDHVKWSRSIESPEELPNVMRRAFRKALSKPRGPVYVDVPLGVQSSRTDAEPQLIGDISSGSGDVDVSQSVDMIDEKEDVVMFVGDEIGIEGQTAIDETVELAEKIDADVYGELLFSRRPFDFESSTWKGGIEHKGSPGSIASSYDLVIEVGCTSNVPLTDESFKRYESPTIVVSHTPDSGSHRERCDVMHCGNIESVCNSIHTSAETKENNSGENNKEPSGPVVAESNPISYKETVNGLNSSISDSCNLFEEGVTVGSEFRGEVRTNVNMYSNKGGGLGLGLPGSIGVQIAEQDYGDTTDPTVALVGDGTFHYYPQSVYSASEYINSSLTIIVPRNQGYEILKNEDRKDKDYLRINNDTSVSNIATDYGLDSEMYNGLEVSSKIREHIDTDKPTLLEIPVDPNLE